MTHMASALAFSLRAITNVPFVLTYTNFICEIFFSSVITNLKTVGKSEIVLTMMVRMSTIIGLKVCSRKVGFSSSTLKYFILLASPNQSNRLYSEYYMHRTAAVNPHLKCTFFNLEVWPLGICKQLICNSTLTARAKI